MLSKVTPRAESTRSPERASRPLRIIFAGAPPITPVILALATNARNAGVASATASTSELVAEMPGERVAEAVAAGFVAAGPALFAALAPAAGGALTAGLSGVP